MQLYEKNSIDEAFEESNETLHTRNMFTNKAHLANRKQQNELFNELLILIKDYIDTIKNPGKKIEWKRSSKEMGYLNYARIFEIMDSYVFFMKGNGFSTGPVFSCNQQLSFVKKSKLGPKFKSSLVIKEILLMLNTSVSAITYKDE